MPTFGSVEWNVGLVNALRKCSRKYTAGLAICMLVQVLFLGQTATADDEEILPPPPVKVLQNRFFKKALRPEVSGFAGSVLNEAYTRTFGLGARLGFFFTEWVGIDYSFTTFQVEDSADLKALRGIEVFNRQSEKTKIEPSFVTLTDLHAVTATIAPIYGKVNVFDFLILYSDIYFSAGAGSLKTNQGVKTPLILAVGQRFYFAKRFNIRIDAADHVFEQSRENLGEVKKSIKHAWTFSAGASVFIW